MTMVLGREPLGAILHSSNEPGELSQWLCHDDSTINIVLDKYIIMLYYKHDQLTIPTSDVATLASRNSLVCIVGMLTGTQVPGTRIYYPNPGS